MDKIDLHDYVDAITELLDKRAIEAQMPHWFTDGNHDDGENDYCYDCIQVLQPEARPGEDYTWTQWPESDDCRHCARCEKLLQYVLTDYGVSQELAHFGKYDFDWAEPTACFELTRIAHGLYTDSQRRQLAEIIQKSLNPPAELSAFPQGENS